MSTPIDQSTRRCQGPAPSLYAGQLPQKVKVLAAQSCPTLCDPTDCNPPASSVHGILQARVLEWVAIPFSGDHPDTGIEPTSPVLAGRFFTSEPPGSLSSRSLPSKDWGSPLLGLQRSLAPPIAWSYSLPPTGVDPKSPPQKGSIHHSLWETLFPRGRDLRQRVAEFSCRKNPFGLMGFPMSDQV